MKKLILSGVAMFFVVCLTAAQGTTYCGSKGNNSGVEFIKRVRLRYIDNVTLSDGGYGNYTSVSTILTQGTYDTIRITPKWVGSAFNEGYSVWIDFNRDGDFNDYKELVLSRPITTDSLIMGAFQIPDTAHVGSTRMRVAMKWNGVPTSCETFQYGEVEDYTINIACASRGTQANWEYIKRVRIKNLDFVSGPNNGYADLSAMSARITRGTLDTITITPKWTGTMFKEGYSVWIDYNRDGDFTDTLEQVAQRAPSLDTLIREVFFIPASTLPGPTKMRVSMKWNGIPASCEIFAYGEVEDYTVNIVTKEKPYCVSKGLSSNEEYINSVSIGYLHNVSGANGGYGDFTSVSTHVAKDSIIGIKITPGWSGTVYKEGYSVWMDYNRDGDFTDSAEQVLTIPATTTPPDYVYFFIPASTPLGPIRMRVSMKYDGIPTSCETFQFGEVEDYTLNIVNKNTVYCRSRGTIVTNGYIDRVTVGVVSNGGMDNISGPNNGYRDFSWMTSLVPVLTRDSASSITVTPWLRANNNVGYSVWIDYNKDGDFLDIGEWIIGTSAITTPPVTFRFNVPASAPIGYTRLRIAMKIGGVPASCDSFPYGEVEDYTVFIENKISHTGQPLASQRVSASEEVSGYEVTTDNLLYPNPAKNDLTIRIEENTVIKSVKVVSGTGSILQHIKQSAKRVDISSLKSGIYLLIIETDKGLIKNKFIKE